MYVMSWVVFVVWLFCVPWFLSLIRSVSFLIYFSSVLLGLSRCICFLSLVVPCYSSFIMFLISTLFLVLDLFLSLLCTLGPPTNTL